MSAPTTPTIANQADLDAWNAAELRRLLNREHGVIESTDDLKGWHLVSANLTKPGVYRYCISRYTNNGAEIRHGYVAQHIITLAIMLRYLSRPNGYTLP